MGNETVVRFPPKLEFLFQPARFKVCYGGRGGAKSWGFARALLVMAAARPLRILCTREVQKSIKDSVHKLLGDQIQQIELGYFYEVLATTIKGKNGSEFIFSGLADQTVESIKSYEGIDIVWVEEAQVVSKRSWVILIPTIRKNDSEIWVSFNPELDTDETYRRFVVDPPPNAVVVKIGYADNPWFPRVLEEERLYCQRTQPEDYGNIWEGNCRAAVSGAIYANELTQAQEKGQFCNLPYDPALKVHVVADLGFNDQMSLILCQRNMSEVRIIDYIEDTHRTLDDYSAQLKNKHMNWGTLYLPHDAKHKTLSGHGKSVEEIMRKLGWRTQIVPGLTIEEGIKVARMALKRTWFDKAKAERLIECLKRYRRSIPVTTGEPGAPVHDEFSHGADAFRYMAIVADSMRNEERMAPIAYNNTGIV